MHHTQFPIPPEFPLGASLAAPGSAHRSVFPMGAAGIDDWPVTITTNLGGIGPFTRTTLPGTGAGYWSHVDNPEWAYAYGDWLDGNGKVYHDPLIVPSTEWGIRFKAAPVSLWWVYRINWTPDGGGGYTAAWERAHYYPVYASIPPRTGWLLDNGDPSTLVLTY